MHPVTRLVMAPWFLLAQVAFAAAVIAGARLLQARRRRAAGLLGSGELVREWGNPYEIAYLLGRLETVVHVAAARLLREGRIAVVGGEVRLSQPDAGMEGAHPVEAAVLEGLAEGPTPADGLLDHPPIVRRLLGFDSEIGSKAYRTGLDASSWLHEVERMRVWAVVLVAGAGLLTFTAAFLNSLPFLWPAVLCAALGATAWAACPGLPRRLPTDDLLARLRALYSPLEGRLRADDRLDPDELLMTLALFGTGPTPFRALGARRRRVSEGDFEGAGGWSM